ncbi:dual OB domain-containing protein [Flavobacterium sp. RSSA_27]|uniref:dual OB domain-containing protein n=1 Tax=Flavobacterium sp. RSSA_27 TaxID=3447667 RepID=UPI003F31EB61
MEVLIVSKTHMSSAACVGGLVLSNNRYVRLLNPGNYNQPTDTDFEVGDIYELTFTARINIHPPHIEDVIISSKTFVRRVDNMPNFLTQRNIIDWNGHINNLFGGLLSWTNSGTGYIPLAGQMPIKSVGFWIADKDLIRVSFENNKVRFRYPNGTNYRNISYVGYQDTLATIPAGTILRVSLSRIFPPENSEITAPRGYYLQLSGWYQGGQQANQPNRQPIVDIDDDLPF